MDAVEFRKYLSTNLQLTSAAQERAASPSAEMANSIIATMVMCGGFAATVVTEAAVAAVLATGYRPTVAPVIGPIVTILTDIADRLQPEEVQAMALHEEGHVVLGHLDGFAEIVDESAQVGLKFDRETAVKNLERIQAEVQLRKELEADAYAAGIMGAVVVRSGIIATIRATCDVVVEMAAKNGNHLNRNAMLEDGLNNPIIAERLRVLAV